MFFCSTLQKNEKKKKFENKRKKKNVEKETCLLIEIPVEQQ